MSDKKISQLTALTGANAAADDQLAIVDTNVAETKKISRAEFFKNTPDIGIGTSSPNALLSVGASYGGTPNIQSAAVIQSTSNTYFTIGAGTSGDSGILFADSADNDVGFVGYNHSTNAMTFGANAGERMRIDSSGNVGIGTTAFAYAASGRGLLELNGSSTAFVALKVGNTAYGYFASSSSVTELAAVGASQPFIFTTNNSERMRIDSSGNVGIGTSSPLARLQVNVTGTTDVVANFFGQNGNNYIAVYDGSGTNATFGSLGGGNAYMFAGASKYAAFYAGGSERMRIDSSGNLLVGTTSNPSSTKVFIDGSSIVGLSLSRSTTDPAGQVVFRNPNGAVGEIYTTGSSTVYATSSDYRLKENIAPMTGALAKVAALKPCTYTWKVDGSDGQGFIAHELAEVLSDAVVGEKDAVDEEGNPKYQGVDTSFLVATLTAALQELSAKVDSLQAELNQIKGA